MDIRIAKKCLEMLLAGGLSLGATAGARAADGMPEVLTDHLPAATVGVAYSAVLEAAGGTAPYVWSVGEGYSEGAGSNTFAVTGTARGWQGDDQCWDLALPFAFPFFGSSYTNAKVNSNGALAFGKAAFTEYRASEAVFTNRPMVAVMWGDLSTDEWEEWDDIDPDDDWDGDLSDDEGMEEATAGLAERRGLDGGRGMRNGRIRAPEPDPDIYVEAGTNSLTVVWIGSYYEEWGCWSDYPAKFSVTLFSDGRIKMSYGGGNQNAYVNDDGGFIGVSAGDGVRWVVSGKSQKGSMEDSEDIWFKPSWLPAALELTGGGVLQGIPECAGKYAFLVEVADASGRGSGRGLMLEVNAGASGGGEGTDGGEWQYVVADGTATVTGGPTNGAIAIPEMLGGVSVTGIGEEAFRDCSGLSSVTIPGSVTNIGWGAFADCDGLAALEIPDSVAEIGGGAFFGCDGLETVSIGAGVRDVFEYAFAACGALPGFEVAEGNEAYTVVDGVLFRKDMRTLVSCPAGKTGEYLVPEGVECIGGAAFYGCTGLTEVELPDSVESLELEAFHGCEFRLTVPGSWEGTDWGRGEAGAGGCEVVYRKVTEQRTVFHGNGGEPDEQVRTNAVGEAYGEMPTATWAGHAVFAGWWTEAAGGEQVTSNSAVTAEAERALWAQWNTKQVTTFKGNGGTPATQRTTNTIGAAYGWFPEVERDGWEFSGWWTKTNGGTRIWATNTVTTAAKRTLYARWTEIPKTLALELASDRLAEGASGVRCVVRRTGPLAAALEVAVASSRPGDVAVPATVTIPAGAKVGSFTAVPTDNDALDGERTAVLSVSAAGYGGADAELTVVDDEVPGLTLEADAASVREGGSLQVLVTREMAGTEALTVNLAGLPTSRLQWPSTVTIADGERSGLFEVSVPDNDVAQAETAYTLRASAVGHRPAALEFMVLDDDVPGVRLELYPESVGEGAGPNAVYATLTRTDATNRLGQAIKVQLAASPSGAVVVPDTVTIPPYTLSVRFGITPVDNGTVDGEREVEIAGQIAIASCGCGGQPSSGEAIRAMLTVVDNDVPALTLKAEPATMKEGLEEAGWLVLGHNSALESDLMVALSYDTAGEISIPATAVIPAGETVVRVPVRTLDDGAEDGAKLVSVYAEDPSGTFAGASTWLQVSDQNLPDLAVASVDAPASVVSKKAFTVQFAVTNAGFAACGSAVPYAVHVVRSQGAALGTNTLATTGTVPVGDGLDVGGALSATVDVAAPELPGDVWVAVVLDPEGTISELDNANNTGWSGAIGVAAAWTATVAADAKTVLPGGRIALAGTATLAEGGPAAGVDVDVYLLRDGMRRTLKAVTAEDGSFAVEWEPSEGEAGHYGVGACYPGTRSAAVQDEFDVLGMRRIGSEPVTWDIALGDEAARTLTLRNASGMALTGLAAEFEGVPAECGLSWELPETLAGNGSVALKITATATGLTEGWECAKFLVRVVSAEGAVLEIPLYFHSQAQQAYLRATPGSIATTMAVGHERYVDVTVVNDGKGDSGAVTAAVPDVPWLKVAAGARTDNLSPGESMTVTLLLCPEAEDGLALNAPLRGGTLAVNCENGRGCTVALEFTPVSEATGNVLVDVVDNNTYYLESAPHLAGATVKVSNPYTGALVARGTTGADGTWRADGLAEGRYQLWVTAPKHETYAGELVVEPGRTARKTVFLQYQLVSATWEVVPVEIEDSYQVKLVLDYETSVPAPVVRTVLPSELPTLPPGDSWAFSIHVVNDGVIRADDVTLTMPHIPGYWFELARNRFSLSAKTEEDVPAVFRRLDSGSGDDPGASSGGSGNGGGGGGHGDEDEEKEDDDDDEEQLKNRSCRYGIRTTWTWKCGNRNTSYSVEQEIRHGECEDETQIPSTGGGWNINWGTAITNTAPNRQYYPGGNGAGGFISPPIRISNWGHCDPCIDTLMEAAARAEVRHAGDPTWILLKSGRDVILDHVPLWSCVDVWVNSRMSFNPDFRQTVEQATSATGMAYLLHEHFQAYNERREPVRAVTAAITDGLGCVIDVAGMAGNFVTGGASGLAADRLKTLLKGLKNINLFILQPVSDTIKLADNLDELNELDHEIILGELDLDPELAARIALNCNGANQAQLRRLIRDYVVVQQYYTTGENLMENVGGNLWKSGYPVEQIGVVWDNAVHSMATNEDKVIDIEDLLSRNKSMISDEEVRTWGNNWNTAVRKFLTGEDDGTALISISRIDYDIIRLYGSLNWIRSQGYSNAEDLLADTLDRLWKIVDEASGKVCASVTMELSQTVAMTREAFDGTLTMYNGNGETALTDLRFEPSILDEEGNECRDLFVAFANGTSGDMAGEDVLSGGMTVAAGGTGSAVIRFVPERGAAPETAKLYRFGGTVTYTDPFSGEAARINLTPVALTVNPSPYLHLDYFVQRDVYGDDSFTAAVVEASLPAELAVLVRNTGAGEARNVTIDSAQPETVLNEKGLAVAFRLSDYSLDAMALNGATAHLGLEQVSLGNIPGGESRVAQWWLTASLQGHFTGMRATVVPVNSWNTPDTALVDPDAKAHMLIRSIVADGDGLPDFLTSEEPDLYGLADTIWTSAGDVLDVAPAGNVAVSGALAGGTVTVRMTATRGGWTYGWKAVPGAEQYEIAQVVRGDGSEVPLRNAWITDRVFRDGGDPKWETRLHIVDDCAQGEQTYIVTLLAKAGDGPEVVSFGGVEAGMVLAASPNAVTVEFSADVDGATFGTEDLVLWYQGATVGNLSGLSISGAGKNWSISGVGNVCRADGRYELVVQAAGIAGVNGALGRSGKSVSWIVCSDTTGPAVLGVERVTGLGGESFRVALSETAIPGAVDAGAVTLTRDGVAVALPGGLAWTDDGRGGLVLSGLESATAADGAYMLMVVGSGLQDAAGNAGSGRASVSWTVDTVPPAAVAGLQIEPDLGESDADGVTCEAEVTVRGTLPVDAVSVTVLARYGSGAETVLAGPFAPEGTELACAVTLPWAGALELVVRCADATGNASETEMVVYLDAIPVTAAWDAVADGRVCELAVLRFNAPVETADVTAARLSLSRDGAEVPLGGVEVTARAGGLAFEVTGLGTVCAGSGMYELRFDGEGVRKASSGLPMGAGTVSTGWTYESAQIAALEARQRYPWNGLVDIDYVLAGDDPAADSWVEVSVRDLRTGSVMPVWSLSGEGADGPVKAGTHRMVWDMAADRGDEFTADALSVEMAARSGDAAYLVVDMGGGTAAASWPVERLQGVPEGGWTDEYKTDKLVLRWIDAGTFTMGSPTNELGRNLDEVQHEVTLTEGFWMGVFEVTQRQWELATGSNPAYYAGAVRPVECVSYGMIRGNGAGAEWPASADVDAGSFLGVLRAKTGLAFDLPTDAQWEYACRAGSLGALNSDKEITVAEGACPAVAEVARYRFNNGLSAESDGKGGYDTAHTAVGSYRPNAWGLFDMHGNVAEWCLDWFDGSPAAGAVTNPVGAASGTNRVYRSGHFDSLPRHVRSADRGITSPGNSGEALGLRLVANGGNAAQGMREIAVSDAFRADTRVEEGKVLSPAETEWATWDTAWNGASSVEVSLTRPDGSVEQLGGASSSWGAGRGSAEWHAGEEEYGRFVLTHTSRGPDGTEMGRLSALFEREAPILASQRVTFMANGGSCGTSEKTYPVGEMYGELPVATKSGGHVFLGWWTDKSGGQQVTSNSMVEAMASLTLWAHWTDRQVTTFLGNGGKPVVQATTNTIYADYGAFPEAKWSGHAFVGWFNAPEGGKRVYTNSTVTLAASRTLYAQWTDQQVTTFKANGGYPSTQKTTNTIYADYGAFPEVKYSGHAFVGWFNAPEGGKRIYTNSTVTLAAGRTLYAQWTTNQVTTFKGNGGTPEIQKTTNAVYTHYGTLPEAVWENHVFLGWFNHPTKGKRVYTNSTVTLAATRSLYAHWTDQQAVTFRQNDGTTNGVTVTHSIGLPYGGMPTPKWSGHVLLGWFTQAEGGDEVTASDLVTAATSRTLWAHWADRQVTVFKGNGGTPETQATTNTIYADYGELPTAKRSGYALVGWFNAPEGGKRVYTNSTVTLAAARTLYAHWTDQQVVTFKGNGGRPGTQKTTNTIYAKYGAFPSVEWSGHVFQGWYNAAEGGKRVYTNSTVTLAATRTLYAHWTTGRGFAITAIAVGADGGEDGPAPRAVRGEEKAESVCRLRFELSAGTEYEIQWTASMSGEWETVERLVAETDGEVEVEIEVPGGEKGFFRLVVFEDGGEED